MSEPDNNPPTTTTTGSTTALSTTTASASAAANSAAPTAASTVSPATTSTTPSVGRQGPWHPNPSRDLEKVAVARALEQMITGDGSRPGVSKYDLTTYHASQHNNTQN
ncbi:hypothetical protein IAT40_004262 [Kwoniella sp. CBS 6097]